MLSEVASFIVVATLLTIAPGQDTFLTLRNASTSGFRRGVETTSGICCGLFLHATLSAAGLSALLIASASALSVLRITGALYLGWLALESLIRARDSFRSEKLPATPTAALPNLTSLKAFQQGFLSNVLNPKTATFYLALLPQFVRSHDNTFVGSLGLATIHFVISFAWLSLLSAVNSAGRDALSSRSASTALHAIAGFALAGFAPEQGRLPDGIRGS